MTDQTPDLAPCPFCGGKAIHQGASIRCNNFGCNASILPRWTKNVVGPAKGIPGLGFNLAAADTRRRWNARAALTSAPEAQPAAAPTSETVTPEQQLARDILNELVRARAKFPGKNVTFAALVEEVGELATATFEESAERVRKEAVQVAVMAMRMVLDGDHCFDGWRAEKGLDHLDPARRALAKGGE